MNILFLTISNITDISSRGIYTDLMRIFSAQGHRVFIATPTERRYKERTSMVNNNRIVLLKIRIPNYQKTSIIEKGLSLILIEFLFLNAIKKHLKKTSFDLVLYSTPPITFAKVIRYIKRKNKAVSYLLLKDIFPQNAVDLKMIKKGGMIHRYFRNKEKSLYAISDFIGCMSSANVEYLRKYNPQISPAIIEVNPNSIEPIESFVSQEDKLKIRQKYHIPGDTTVFIYGGNLGKPQGIDFFLKVLESLQKMREAFFVIAGSGTEYNSMRSWFDRNKPRNALLLNLLPKDEFDLLVQSCDVGLIFLDRRFSVPNFPSRLLSYMEYKMPAIAATDRNTDIGQIMIDNNFGFWPEAGDIQGINKNIAALSRDEKLRLQMGKNGYNYLYKNYTVNTSYQMIMRHLTNKV